MFLRDVKASLVSHLAESVQSWLLEIETGSHPSKRISKQATVVFWVWTLSREKLGERKTLANEANGDFAFVLQLPSDEGSATESEMNTSSSGDD